MTAKPFTQYLYSLLRQTGQECRQLLYKLARAGAATPLPRFLVYTMAIVLLISLIPFALAVGLALIVFRLLITILASSRQASTEHSQRPRYLYQRQQSKPAPNHHH